MIAKKWLKASLIVGLIGSAILAPSGASAAAPATPFDVEVFGHSRPGDPGAGDPLTGTGALYANSAPFGPGVTEEGMIHFRGKSDPSVEIVVQVDEVPDDPATPTIEMVVTTRSTDGYFENAIGNCGTATYPSPPPCVHPQSLGVHAATVTDPTEADPTKWGKTELRVRLRSRNPGTGELSPAVDRTIIKYAGTPLDNRAPIFSRLQFPPTNWCHQPGIFTVRANTSGGSAPGITCGGDQTNPHQSLTGPPPINQCPTDNTLQISSLKLGSCSGISIVGGSGSDCVCGEVKDNHANSLGLASEIADVTITITGGTLPAPRVYNSPLVRGGSHAGFGVNLRINDFEPNWPDRPVYTATVVAKDAWGKTVTQSSNFNVMPF